MHAYTVYKITMLAVFSYIAIANASCLSKLATLNVEISVHA